ncbi:MAG: peptidoglycan-binding domain-containing protein [Propionibacteriaceae bacterium]|nr:peptidoglycan-binding domain-containing protein [Propionibacteriaceae bacterium]
MAWIVPDIWLTHLSWVTRQSWRSPTGQAFWAAGRQTVPPRVIVEHSTETVGYPGYRGGADAPHFTINLWTGHVRQHIPLNWGARALALSSGGITDRTVNVTGVIQIEVIGAVTPGYPSRYGHYDLPGRYPSDRAAQGYLARLWRAIHEACPTIPLQLSSYARWVPYPASYGARARQRLTSGQFRDARGIVGHMHVPGNDHGDGLAGRAVNGRAIDLEATLALAKAGTTRPAPPARPAPTPDATTKDLQRHLIALGYDLGESGADGHFGPLTEAASAAYRHDFATGPLPTTTALLASLGDTVSKIDTLIKEVRSLRAAVDKQRPAPTAAQIAAAVWTWVAPHISPFNAYWHLRGGRVDNPEHRAHPADPGSDSDRLAQVHAATTGKEG